MPPILQLKDLISSYRLVDLPAFKDQYLSASNVGALSLEQKQEIFSYACSIGHYPVCEFLLTNEKEKLNFNSAKFCDFMPLYNSNDPQAADYYQKILGIPMHGAGNTLEDCLKVVADQRQRLERLALAQNKAADESRDGYRPPL